MQGKLFIAHFATFQRKGAQSLFPSSYTLEKAVLEEWEKEQRGKSLAQLKVNMGVWMCEEAERKGETTDHYS